MLVESVNKFNEELANNEIKRSQIVRKTGLSQSIVYGCLNPKYVKRIEEAAKELLESN